MGGSLTKLYRKIGLTIVSLAFMGILFWLVTTYNYQESASLHLLEWNSDRVNLSDYSIELPISSELWHMYLLKSRDDNKLHFKEIL